MKEFKRIDEIAAVIVGRLARQRYKRCAPKWVDGLNGTSLDRPSDIQHGQGEARAEFE